MNTMQALYDSEINCDLSTFWDEGFTWRVGDAHNGWKERGSATSLEAAEKELSESACHHYPESVFAKAMARDKTPGAPGPPYCCKQDCPNDAEFEVYSARPDNSLNTLRPYAHACEEHVGSLCDSPVGGPEVPSWTVLLLPSYEDQTPKDFPDGGPA